MRTYCLGQCASMGAWILASGAKGKRYSLPNARIMIHQPLGGATGQASDILIQADELVKTKEKMCNILSQHTAQPQKQILSDIDRDFFMSPEQAKEYGLVDEVLRNEDRINH